MDFDNLLMQVLDLLRREGRVSYRALKVRFQLDDDVLEALKAGLIARNIVYWGLEEVASRFSVRTQG